MVKLELFYDVGSEEFSNDYLISMKGNIRNKYRGRSLKPYIYKDKVCVNLKSDYQKKVISVPLDYLLAITFIGKDPDPFKNIISHIDGDPLNNNLDNLKWISQYEKIQSIKFIICFKNGKFCKMYDNKEDIEKDYSIDEEKLDSLLDSRETFNKDNDDYKFIYLINFLD